MVSIMWNLDLTREMIQMCVRHRERDRKTERWRDREIGRGMEKER